MLVLLVLRKINETKFLETAAHVVKLNLEAYRSLSKHVMQPTACAIKGLYSPGLYVENLAEDNSAVELNARVLVSPPRHPKLGLVSVLTHPPGDAPCLGELHRGAEEALCPRESVGLHHRYERDDIKKGKRAGESTGQTAMCSCIKTLRRGE